jgi:transposase
MDVVHRCCCGVDVHKDSVTACVVWAEAGGKKRQEKRRFATFTRDLLALADWLRACCVTHVAMESTGVYWQPVWHVREGQFEWLLVNAQHVKAIPGKKTDRRDSAWLAELLQHGLLKSSFVPPAAIRELRDLTRYRVTLCQECHRIANRIQKVLEDANLKLASVASDPLGASGRAMLKALIAAKRIRRSSPTWRGDCCDARFPCCRPRLTAGSPHIIVSCFRSYWITWNLSKRRSPGWN